MCVGIVDKIDLNWPRRVPPTQCQSQREREGELAASSLVVEIRRTANGISPEIAIPR